MMNATLFAQLVPVLNAYLNAEVDTKLKTWHDVVELFFVVNVNRELKLMSEIAEAFEHVSRPNHFRIKVFSLEFIFPGFCIAAESLTEEGYKEHVSFIEDEDDGSVRITFNTFRRLIFTKASPESVDAFEFVDNVYQIYQRYELAMMHRSNRPTHIDHAQLKNPKKKASFRIMDAQPIVLYIAKGTKKTIQYRLEKYENGDTDQHYSPERIVPIFEATVSSVDLELDAITTYINETHAVPYRRNQIENNNVKINRTKHCIKFLKNHILLDPSQDVYTLDMFIQDIATVRMRLKKGQSTYADRSIHRSRQVRSYERSVL